MKLLLNQRGQAVYPTAEICVAAGDIYPVGTIDVNVNEYLSQVLANI